MAVNSTIKMLIYNITTHKILHAQKYYKAINEFTIENNSKLDYVKLIKA